MTGLLPFDLEPGPPRIVAVLPQRRVWLVGFGPGDGITPWTWRRPFTSRGYRHVVAMAEEAGGTLIVNPLSHRLMVEWSPRPLGTMVRGAMERGGLFFVAYQAVILPHPAGLRPLTCVEIVKHLLGVRTPFVVTVRQLYRWLRARGARPVVLSPRTQPQE